jgi:hypothetical protein
VWCVRRSTEEKQVKANTDREHNGPKQVARAFDWQMSGGIIFQLCGRTETPFATAMSTAIENDRTSTMTTASLVGMRLSNPSSPHSQRRSSSSRPSQEIPNVHGGCRSGLLECNGAPRCRWYAAMRVNAILGIFGAALPDRTEQPFRATRGRSAMEGGDERAGAKRVPVGGYSTD